MNTKFIPIRQRIRPSIVQTKFGAGISPTSPLGKASCTSRPAQPVHPVLEALQLMDAALAADVLKEALERYGSPEIVNTDRGSQYTSHEHVKLPKTNGIRVYP